MKLDVIDDAIRAGFFVSFEADLKGEDDDGLPAIWYCEMYLGDQDAPWKSGTTQGRSWGSTQAEAFENCKHSLVTK